MAKITAIAANVAGSVADTPTSRLAITRVSAIAASNTEHDAADAQPQTLADNQRHDAAAGGAEGHAHADLRRR